MKKQILIGVAILGICAMSFKAIVEKNSAKVDEIDGIKVFCYSKPTNQYDILGQVKIKGLVKSERGYHMVKLLSEAAKKEYPSAEGIIIATSDFERAEVIRIKE